MKGLRLTIHRHTIRAEWLGRCRVAGTAWGLTRRRIGVNHAGDPFLDALQTLANVNSPDVRGEKLLHFLVAVQLSMIDAKVRSPVRRR